MIDFTPKVSLMNSWINFTFNWHIVFATFVTLILFTAVFFKKIECYEKLKPKPQVNSKDKHRYVAVKRIITR